MSLCKAKRIGRRGWLRGFFLILKFFIFFSESFNATCCVDELLLAGKKWMAFRTYFNTDIGFGRSDFDFIAACASDAGYLVLRMNSLFHNNFNPLNNFYKSFSSWHPFFLSQSHTAVNRDVAGVIVFDFFFR